MNEQSSIDGVFSIAMLKYQRVTLTSWDQETNRNQQNDMGCKWQVDQLIRAACQVGDGRWLAELNPSRPNRPNGQSVSHFRTDFDQKMGSEPRVAQVLFSWLTDSFSILAVPASRSFKPEQAAKHSQGLSKYVKDTRISRGKEQGNQSILFLPAGWFQNLSVAVIISGMVIRYLDFLDFFS